VRTRLTAETKREREREREMGVANKERKKERERARSDGEKQGNVERRGARAVVRCRLTEHTYMCAHVRMYVRVCVP